MLCMDFVWFVKHLYMHATTSIFGLTTAIKFSLEKNQLLSWIINKESHGWYSELYNF